MPLVTVVSVIVLMTVTAAAFLVGSSSVSLVDLVAWATGGDVSAAAKSILVNVRLPRVLAALLAGGALAVAGAIIQAVLDNPLASPNIIGIKEASGNISYAAKIARYLSDDFVMYSGNDDMIVPMLALGASGVISVLANVAPRETHRMVMDFLEGRVKESRDLQLKLLEVTNDLFIEVNPIPVKEALNLMGKDVGGYRLPLCPMTEAHRETLRRSMAAAGLI